MSEEAAQTEGTVVEPSEPQGASEAVGEKVSKEPELPDWAKPGFKHKIKTDGQELELDYEDLVRRAQKASTADKRLEEAAMTKKQIKAFLDNVQTNPVAALKQLEATPYFQENPKAILDLLGPEKARKFAEDLLWEDIQKEKMSPEQRELDQLRREKQEWEARRQAEEEETRTREFEAQKAHYQEQYMKSFGEALETSGLPKTPETVEVMASLYLSALENNYEPDMKELVGAVKEQIMGRTKSLLSGLTEESLFEFLGEDVATKIRKYDLSRLKSPTSKQSPIVQDDDGEVVAGNKNLSLEEARKLWRQRAGLSN